MRIPVMLTGGLGMVALMTVAIALYQHSSDAATDSKGIRTVESQKSLFDETRLPRIEVERGLQLSPVPLNLTGKSRAFVGWGSYIVNAQGACNDCHTNPPFVEGGNPFLGQPEQINSSGFLAGGTSFGPVVSANITPYIDGLPGGYTYAQFKTLIRTGVEEDGGILQVMPWPIYGKMTDRDLYAVYEYLRAIPPVYPPDSTRTR